MEPKDKFTVKIKEDGVLISGADKNGQPAELWFTSVEALMLIDILQHEKARIRQSANESSPTPFTFHFGNS